MGYDQVNRLATQYAIAWADCADSPTGTCKTEMNDLAAPVAIANIFPLLQNSSITLQMFEITMNGATPSVVYAHPSGASLTAAQTTAAQASFTNGQYGVIVTASYSYSLVYFESVMTPFLGNALTSSYTVTQLKQQQ